MAELVTLICKSNYGLKRELTVGKEYLSHGYSHDIGGYFIVNDFGQPMQISKYYFMDNKNVLLLAYVSKQHGDQKRKYTGDPYVNHLIAVAEMADGRCEFGWEIGLCHDLFEDTTCNLPDLYEALQQFGYDEPSADFICDRVDDLTDVYTAENSPELNRKHRKHLEALRLHYIHPDSQTVKYCDLINNTESIVQHDRAFALVYLAEKRNILNGMDQGDHELYMRCFDVLTAAEAELSKKTV